MISPRLRAYLVLEREMLVLDTKDDRLADLLRDAMDPLWYSLTEEEHDLLDQRQLLFAPEVGIMMPIAERIFVSPKSVDVGGSGSRCLVEVRGLVLREHSPAITVPASEELLNEAPPVRPLVQRSEPICEMDWRCSE